MSTMKSFEAAVLDLTKDAAIDLNRVSGMELMAFVQASATHRLANAAENIASELLRLRQLGR